MLVVAIGVKGAMVPTKKWLLDGATLANEEVHSYYRKVVGRPIFTQILNFNFMNLVKIMAIIHRPQVVLLNAIINLFRLGNE